MEMRALKPIASIIAIYAMSTKGPGSNRQGRSKATIRAHTASPLSNRCDWANVSREFIAFTPFLSEYISSQYSRSIDSKASENFFAPDKHKTGVCQSNNL
jgi:hypothetical protein